MPFLIILIHFLWAMPSYAIRGTRCTRAVIDLSLNVNLKTPPRPTDFSKFQYKYPWFAFNRERLRLAADRLRKHENLDKVETTWFYLRFKEEVGEDPNPSQLRILHKIFNETGSLDDKERSEILDLLQEDFK